MNHVIGRLVVVIYKMSLFVRRNDAYPP
jgi:hypothetical protein